MLETLHAEATAAETVVRARAETDAIDGALDTLVGIGAVLELTLRAEIGDGTAVSKGRRTGLLRGPGDGVDASGDR